MTYSYAYSDTDHFYLHEARQLATERATKATSLLNEHTLNLEVDITDRLSLVAEVPFLYGIQSRNGPGSTAINGDMQASGLGDMRFLARFWFFQEEQKVRLYVAAGVRAPTGESEGGFTSFANRRVDKDVSAQEGTGNFAGVIELGGSGSVTDWLGVFFQARYVFTPGNNALSENFRWQLTGAGPHYNSDADTALWKIGATLPIGRLIREKMTEEPNSALDGLAFLFAIDGAHVPYEDLIGGSSGFRRGANIFFVEPGFAWAPNDIVTFSISVPVTVYKYVMKNGGNVPEYVVQAGMTISLN